MTNLKKNVADQWLDDYKAQPTTPTPKNPAAVAMGSIKTAKKAQAARRNGILYGGRPCLITWEAIGGDRWRGTRDGVSAEGKSKVAIRATLIKKLASKLA